uniref:Gag protein n=1 Tax=Panagrolaimus sp. ES5 TaxID=591445 RepID=A0AC34F9P1_9BILA
MTRTPPQQTTSSAAPAIDTAALVAALQALAQNGQTVPQQAVPVPSIPRFEYDPAMPDCAALWFKRLAALFRTFTLTDAEKCAHAVNALDSSTFNKVARGLLSVPADIATLTDFDQLQKTMIQLFDRKESVFAKRYSFFHMEWKGPEHESITEFCARMRENVASCDPASFNENALLTLGLLMSMKHPALERFRIQVLNLLNNDPATTLLKCEDAISAAYQTQQEQLLPMDAYVNYVKKIDHRPHRSTSPTPSDSSSHTSASSSSKHGLCNSCGGRHRRSTCKYRDAKCYACGTSGH